MVAVDDGGRRRPGQELACVVDTAERGQCRVALVLGLPKSNVAAAYTTSLRRVS